ncbi:hypothetical protein T484DRAFT_1923078, partial [Baffinella frigidus]
LQGGCLATVPRRRGIKLLQASTLSSTTTSPKHAHGSFQVHPGGPRARDPGDRRARHPTIPDGRRRHLRGHRHGDHHRRGRLPGGGHRRLKRPHKELCREAARWRVPVHHRGHHSRLRICQRQHQDRPSVLPDRERCLRRRQLPLRLRKQNLVHDASSCPGGPGGRSRASGHCRRLCHPHQVGHLDCPRVGHHRRHWRQPHRFRGHDRLQPGRGFIQHVFHVDTDQGQGLRGRLRPPHSFEDDHRHQRHGDGLHRRGWAPHLG